MVQTKMAAENQVESRVRDLGNRVTTVEVKLDHLDQREAGHHTRQEKRLDEQEDVIDGTSEHPGLKTKVSKVESAISKFWWLIMTFLGAGITALVGVAAKIFGG